jgi:hypothetical protein
MKRGEKEKGIMPGENASKVVSINHWERKEK